MLHPVIEKKIERNLQESFALPGFNKLTAKDHLTLSESFPLITAVLHTPKGGDPTYPTDQPTLVPVIYASFAEAVVRYCW